MFDTIIVNLNAGSYLCMKPQKDLAKADKDKKGKYLQAFLERRCSFNPMVYYVDRIPILGALAEQRRLAPLLSFI